MKLLTFAVLGVFLAFGHPYAQERPMKVILDTDIGDDIDDAWALAFVIAHKNFEPLGITVAHGNTPARGKMACKMLHLTGRGTFRFLLAARPSKRNTATNSRGLKISPLNDLTRKEPPISSWRLSKEIRVK